MEAKIDFPNELIMITSIDYISCYFDPNQPLAYVYIGAKLIKT